MDNKTVDTIIQQVEKEQKEVQDRFNSEGKNIDKKYVQAKIEGWMNYGQQIGDVKARDIIRTTCAYWNFAVLDSQMTVTLGSLPKSSSHQQ